MAFYLYSGPTGMDYPALNLTAVTGRIYDFGANTPPADGRWASNAGPATGFTKAGTAVTIASPAAPASPIGLPAVAATDGQVYGYDATLGGTRAFDRSSVQTWRSYDTAGTPKPVAAATTVTVATLVLPTSVAVPVELGGVFTVTATSACTNIYISLSETANGTDTPISVSGFLSALANGSSLTLSVPDLACYIPATGRQRTLLLQAFTTTGTLSVLNSSQFPSVLRARGA